MACLYVTSVEKGAGKTTVCAGLGRHLMGKGKKTGFFKLVIGGGLPEGTADPDALFIKQALGLTEAVENICPVMADNEGIDKQVKAAYSKIASGMDVVITEGVFEPELIQALDARVIAVEGYSDQSPLKSVDAYKDLSKHLLGVVLNKVPVNRLEKVKAEIAVKLSDAGVKVLALLPEGRVLLAPSIGELAEWVQGEILNSAEQSAELAEAFMAGAMTVDPGPLYFGRKSKKAVVVRSERPDMQLAALETSTRCLILCGGTPPTHAVLYEAEKKKVPVISASGDVAGTVDIIEDALGKARFNQEAKLPKLAEIMEKYFDFPPLYRGLGLAS